MLFGATVYLLFTSIVPLKAPGELLGPMVVQMIPALIFTILYVTFCKIHIEDMRPHAWHFWLQLIRVALSALMVAIVALARTPEEKIVLEGVFICIICPTAAAAPVITEKLGGSIESLTVYTLIANVVTAVIIPAFFPLVEKGADLSFAFAFLMILKRVVMVLLLPLCLALLTRQLLPRVAGAVASCKNLGFYMWCINLSVVMGLTLHHILTSQVSGLTLLLLITLPAAVTVTLFAIGKSVGRCYGESVCAGQALGQKNTMVGIWLTVTFLNPTAAIAPCAYVVWQNLVNTWQLWYKRKYGRLKF